MRGDVIGLLRAAAFLSQKHFPVRHFASAQIIFPYERLS